MIVVINLTPPIQCVVPHLENIVLSFTATRFTFNSIHHGPCAPMYLLICHRKEICTYLGNLYSVRKRVDRGFHWMGHPPIQKGPDRLDRKNDNGSGTFSWFPPRTFSPSKPHTPSSTIDFFHASDLFLFSPAFFLAMLISLSNLPHPARHLKNSTENGR